MQLRGDGAVMSATHVTQVEEHARLRLPNHMLDGEIVRVIRRYRQFVVVRMLRTRGDYARGADLRFLPHCVVSP